ncbi:EAL and HDOD domain-containing protein [Amphritea balenae]|uniref:HDOD domain-containing protein n=1 Tax=Amphritea balenae TaxID=452629 RepID=A0A3P1SLN9_9GAMM|nr:HDOD domain-containing protein [Amphritea balenae]RRC97920.1 HDOD domain-containing protein [Amphritea balenae]GGK81776.1 histidine kinase [Amphritea balenae]
MNSEQPVKEDRSGLIVRQPIFNEQLKVVSYQLCYEKNLEPGNALLMDGPSAATLLLSTYASLSQDGNIRKVPLFLPFSAELLTETDLPHLPKRNMLIEIPPNTKVTRALLFSIVSLRQEGYRIVLDGFALQKHLFPLLRFANIIKVDMARTPRKKLLGMLKILRKLKGTLLAQNVDTFDTLQICKRAGFKLFQGSFISKPATVHNDTISTKSAALLQLIQALQKPEIKPQEIESLVILDPILSFKMLRVINSAAYSLPNKIESLQQAIVMLGLDQIRSWATIIMLSNQEGKPEEWSRNLIARARMCELLAELDGHPKPESAFLVGMLSLLDLLLEARIELILEQVAVDEEVKIAVLKHHGPLGKILHAVISFENGDWGVVKRCGIPEMLFKPAYRHSMNWTESAMQAIHQE